MGEEPKTGWCVCGWQGPVSDADGFYRCPHCAAHIRMVWGGVTREFRVEGHNAAEVEAVSSKLVAAAHAEQRMARNPWVSGSFYLVVILSVVTLSLVAARMVSIIALPIVIIAGLVGVSVVGALQLRQDQSLSERGFLKLMAMSFRQLPFIGKGNKNA